MKQHTGPSSSYGIPDKQNDRKTHMQPIPAKTIKVQFKNLYKINDDYAFWSNISKPGI
jgi:hypothetical protein